MLLAAMIGVACAGGGGAAPTTISEPTTVSDDTPIATSEATAVSEDTPTPTNEATSVSEDTPTPTNEATPVSEETPAPTSEATPTTVAPTATPTLNPTPTLSPTPPPEVELAITREFLPALVLVEEDIESRFPTLVLDPAATGFKDNESIANGALLPNDDADDLAALGRLDGYSVEFPDPGGLFLVQSSLDQFNSNDSAIGFIEHQIDVLATLVGVEVQPGITIDDFQVIEPPELGEPTIAYVVVATFSDFIPPLVANFTFVSWVRENVVANAGVVGFTSEDRTEDVNFLAKQMNLRITSALFGLIEVPPTIVVLPTVTPPPNAEERAVSEGFTLPAMLLTLDDLSEGTTVEFQSFVEFEGLVSTYERNFVPEDLVIELGGSTLVSVGTRVDLYSTAEDALSFVEGLEALETETLEIVGDQLGAFIADEAGFTPLEIVTQTLDVVDLGDLAVGFLLDIETAEVVPLDAQVIFIARGRIVAQVTFLGLDLSVLTEDTVPLAELIDQLILENSPP